MIEQAVILATGYGVRLGSLIKDRPKAMLPVLGKPIVIRVMDRLREAGIRNFIVVVGEHEGEVASYLNTSWVPDAKIQIALQPDVRGPVDALGCASGYLTGPFILASCDVLTPYGHIPALIKHFNSTKADMTLSLVSAAANPQLDGVTTNGDAITEITDKAPTGRRSLGSFPLYACSKRLLNYTSGAARSMVGAVQSLLKADGKVNYVTAEWYLHLNAEIDLLTINKRLLREDRDTHILSELPTSVHVTPPVRIDPQVSIAPGAKIGPNVYIESGAHVGRDAVIWDSLILRNADIADNEVVHGQIVARRARISEEPLATEQE